MTSNAKFDSAFGILITSPSNKIRFCDVFPFVIRDCKSIFVFINGYSLMPDFLMTSTSFIFASSVIPPAFFIASVTRLKLPLLFGPTSIL